MVAKRIPWKKYVLPILFVAFFLYTRLVGLDWGLPYPMHPDERNMAVALQGLKCPQGAALKDCFNPQFFAYGQFPLYVAFILIKGAKIIRGALQSPIDFNEATMALRLVSVIASGVTLFYAVRVVHMLRGLKKINGNVTALTILLFTFVPYGIQFAHFGTTESLLMALYTAITFYSLRLNSNAHYRRSLFMLSLFLGIAIATKLSSLLFIGLPFVAILSAQKQQARLIDILFVTVYTAIFSVLFSPHNILSFEAFMGAITYEVSIGQGTIIMFYNRQFQHTIPILFQMKNILPYVLGVGQFVLAALVFFAMPFSRKYNLLRVALLLFFIPTAFLYAKWTRFIAPILPIMTVCVIVGVLSLESIAFRLLRRKLLSRIVVSIIICLLIIPGIAYVSIYRSEDVRVVASRWIAQNVPGNSYILSETANVVDIPIAYSNSLPVPPYNISSFDFYHIDENVELANSLNDATAIAPYVFIPSRRIFANHTCYRFENGTLVLRENGIENVLQGYSADYCNFVKEKYPRLNWYYEQLFSGKLGYDLAVEIVSYPRISLFGKTLYEVKDENAEETWTVFDHPVIRIYKRS